MAAHSADPEVSDETPCIAFDYVRPGDRRTTFEAGLLHADRDVVIMSHTAHPSKPLYHAGQPVIEDGYDVVWFLLKGEPYDIGRFYRPDGTWTGYFIDILEPVQWHEDDALSIDPLIDLALDLWIAPDESYQVLDEDEFVAFISHGELSSDQASHARQTLAELVSAHDFGSFPPAIVKNYGRASR